MDNTEFKEIVGSVGPRATWPFSLDTIQMAMSPYPPRSRQALVAAFMWCNDPMHPLTRKEFAKRVGSNENTLYKIFTGTYLYDKQLRGKDGKPHPKAGQMIYPADELIKAIEDFLSLEKQRFLAGETQFVLTPTAKRIVTLCDLARESQTICVLFGPSHIGKTWTFTRHYTPNNNHGRTVYVRMQAASGLGGMVRAIAVALGISPKGNTTDLIHRIKNALTSDMLLILDEMSLLAHTYRLNSFFNCIEVLREIHDETKCGMVWCFTQIKNFMEAKDKELQQAWRRGVHKLMLPSMPTEGDVDAILKHNDLELPGKDFKVEFRFRDGSGKTITVMESPREILRQVAKDEALLAITERLRYARALAKKADEKLNWQHFITAHLTIRKQSQTVNEWE